MTIERSFKDSPAVNSVPEGFSLSKAKGNPNEKAFQTWSYDVHYDESVLVGYRWYEKKGIEPLFPFGYGLSYTEYSYKDLSVTVEENEIIAGATVENIGDFDGVEVVQLYIQDVVGSIVRPVKELKGYQRIALKAKEKKQVTFILEKSELGFYDYNLNYVVEAGKFKLWIGHDSDAMLCEEFEL
jgi:beta-glucosidase